MPRIFVLQLALPLVFCASLAMAADPLVEGNASYTAGNYAAAKSQFMAAVKAKPKSWQAQYQLGNACLQLKERENAKNAYRQCLTLKPDAEIKRRCESAINYLSAPPTPPPPVVPPKREVESYRGGLLNGGSTSGSSSFGGSSDDGRQQGIEAHKKRILDEAQEQAERIKAEEKQAVDEGNANSNHRYRNRDTGERYTSMTADETAAIKSDYERRSKEVLKEARRRANEVTAP